MDYVDLATLKDTLLEYVSNVFRTNFRVQLCSVDLIGLNFHEFEIYL